MTGYDELSGSPRESLNESSGSSVERKFLVASNTRLAFAQALIGTGYPNFPQARVVAVDIQPWNDDLVPSGVIVDPSLTTAGYGAQPSLITVRYGPDFTQKAWPTEFPKPATIRVGTELRYQVRGSAQFLLIPSAGCYWEDDVADDIPVPEDTNSTVLIPMRSYQLQWDFVDDPPIDRFEELQGKVNSDMFLGSEPETLLFENYDITETFRAAPLNPHTNRVMVNLTRRRIEDDDGVYGWNHDYREEPAGWARLLLSDEKPRYKEAAFAGMFA